MASTTPAILQYSIVPFTYSRIFPHFPSGGAQRIKKDLEEFNCSAVLEFCAKIALLLFVKGEGHQETQLRLTRRVFSQEFRKRLLEILEKEQDKPRGPFTIFHEQPLLYVAKEALFFSHKGSKGTPVNPQNIEKVGMLFLVATDVCLGWSLGTALNLPLQLEVERVRQSFSRYQFFNSNDFFPYQLARHYQIFERAREIAVLKKTNLDKIFAKATGGVSLSNFSTITFAILANWYQSKQGGPDIEREWTICEQKYFAQTKLDKTQINKLLRFLSFRAKDFGRQYNKLVKDILKGKDVPEYNFLLFRQKPLIHLFNDCYVCLSPRFLVERVTEGVYWIVENHLRKSHSKLKNLWPDIWGQAYEEYTNEILSRIFTKNYHPNFKDNKGIERADGLWVGSKVTVLLEIKYAHWRYMTKISGSKETTETDLQHLIKGGNSPKGVGQLAKNINSYLKGEWGIPPEGLGVKRILPILIVGERMPMDAYNRFLYDKLAKDAGFDFPGEVVMPYIILEPEDVEILETYSKLNGSENTEKILIAYSELFSWKGGWGFVRDAINFKNFLLGRIDTGVLPKNQRLMGVYNPLVTKTREDCFGITKTKNN